MTRQSARIEFSAFENGEIYVIEGALTLRHSATREGHFQALTAEQEINLLSAAVTATQQAIRELFNTQEASSDAEST